MSEKLMYVREPEDDEPPCPFQVGDRIHEWAPQASWSTDDGKTWQTEERKPDGRPDAIVTAITPRGFEYRYTERVTFIAREGSWVEGGECFSNGYDHWFRVMTRAPKPDFFRLMLDLIDSDNMLARIEQKRLHDA